MNTRSSVPTLDRLVGPLGDCLTPESARRLLALKADSELQARVDDLAERCNLGSLTPEERDEYSSYVTFGTFVAILKSKARQLLANSGTESSIIYSILERKIGAGISAGTARSWLVRLVQERSQCKS